MNIKEHIRPGVLKLFRYIVDKNGDLYALYTIVAFAGLLIFHILNMLITGNQHISEIVAIWIAAIWGIWTLGFVIAGFVLLVRYIINDFKNYNPEE